MRTVPRAVVMRERRSAACLQVAATSITARLHSRGVSTICSLHRANGAEQSDQVTGKQAALQAKP